jgi:hypothetical protein
MNTDTHFCAAGAMDPNEWIADRQLDDWRNHNPAVVTRAFVEKFLRASAATATAAALETVEERFIRLADEWSRDTRYISSVNDLVKDDRYQQIIGMGWDVLPYLLSDLSTRKRFWFPALAEITNLRPFDRKDAGNYKRMTEAWTRWGRLRGLI